MVVNLLGVLGAALIVAGAALVFVPAALVVSGAFVCLAAWSLST